jgi:hypothetical protein
VLLLPLLLLLPLTFLGTPGTLLYSSPSHLASICSRQCGRVEIIEQSGVTLNYSTALLHNQYHSNTSSHVIGFESCAARNQRSELDIAVPPAFAFIQPQRA